MMKFGFCNLSVVPVRREPSDKAEMSTQLLFGDILEALGQSGSWLQVKIYYDGYEGWVDARQIHEIKEEEYRRLIASPLFINRQLLSDAVVLDDQLIRVPAGCSFYGLEGSSMFIGGQKYVLEGSAWPFAFESRNKLLQTANEYLSCPYLWGGKTCMGLDCSGFTQVVYKQHGVRLLRDAAQQASQGELISMISDGLPGDLVFFDNTEGRIVHVGIILDNQNVIHCSGKVRIDHIDHQGIFNRDQNRYTHNFRLIRRVID
ncbi:MAG: C40 family peptidase [Bacteroidales bacterium]|jgi:hypothetical protein|nr:C40 family peptidase [Bacteroidales bacterium]